MCYSSEGPPNKGEVWGPLKTHLETLTKPPRGPPGGPPRLGLGAAGAAAELPLPLKGPLRLSVSSVAAGDRHALLLLNDGKET